MPMPLYYACDISVQIIFSDIINQAAAVLYSEDALDMDLCIGICHRCDNVSYLSDFFSGAERMPKHQNQIPKNIHLPSFGAVTWLKKAYREKRAPVMSYKMTEMGAA
jgi:hypothetical protein